MFRAALAAAVFATLAVAGCKKADDTSAATTTPTPATAPAPGPATLPPPATVPPPAAMAFTVTTVDLGNAVGVDNRIGAPLTSFAKTDTIHASVATDGSSAGTLGAKWSFQDGQVIDTQEKSVPAGPQVTEFSIAKPSGWPAGHYKVEFSTNGVIAQVREFDVK